ncbi:MAG: NYN domain-containing protein [Sandaracinaceae bacterium]
MPRVFVDGFNVINAVLLRGQDRDGWWRETHRAALVAWLRSGELKCTVVFDGEDERVRTEAGVEVRYTPDADAWIVEHTSADDVVVTRDRRLADRLRSRGIRSRSPRWLEDELGPFTSA